MTFSIWSTSACGHLSVGFTFIGALVLDSRVWADATALLPSTAATSTAIATRMRIHRVSHRKSHSQRRQPARVAAGHLGSEAVRQVDRPEHPLGCRHEG